MKVYHFTPTRNIKSIMRHGLYVSHHRGKIAALWFCGEERLVWALYHVARHQDVEPKALTLLQASVHRGLLCRRRSGIYLCGEDVPPNALKVCVPGYDWVSQDFAFISLGGN